MACGCNKGKVRRTTPAKTTTPAAVTNKQQLAAQSTTIKSPTVSSTAPTKRTTV